MKLFLPFVAVCLVLAILSSPALANDWHTIKDCRLIPNESNDGDSFHVKADGKEHIFRLYFVDCPEAESGGYVVERVTEQAKHFGISEEASVAMGKKAAAFTRATLSRPFTVTTRGEDAMGSSRLKREYAFIETADGQDLGELLLSRGMARSFGNAAAPPGKSVSVLRGKYDRIEGKARAERVGAWGKDATQPTLELSSSEDTKKASEESKRSTTGTGMPDITDLMPSMSDVLGTPID